MARVRRYARRRAQPEAELQRAAAKLLDSLGLWWCHIPNGGARDARVGAELKRQGVKPGAPDAYIFDIPPKCPCARGVAIEFKTNNGRLTDSQKQWVIELDRRGCLYREVRSFDELVDFMIELGFADGVDDRCKALCSVR